MNDIILFGTDVELNGIHRQQMFSHAGQPRAQKRTEPESSHANVSKAMRKLNLSRNTEMIEMGHKETRLNASSDMRTNGQSGRFNQTNSTTDTESDTESDTEDDITDTMKYVVFLCVCVCGGKLSRITQTSNTMNDLRL